MLLPEWACDRRFDFEVSIVTSRLHSHALVTCLSDDGCLSSRCRAEGL